MLALLPPHLYAHPVSFHSPEPSSHVHVTRVYCILLPAPVSPCHSLSNFTAIPMLTPYLLRNTKIPTRKNRQSLCCWLFKNCYDFQLILFHMLAPSISMVVGEQNMRRSVVKKVWAGKGRGALYERTNRTGWPQKETLKSYIPKQQPPKIKKKKATETTHSTYILFVSYNFSLTKISRT